VGLGTHDPRIRSQAGCGHWARRLVADRYRRPRWVPVWHGGSGERRVRLFHDGAICRRRRQNVSHDHRICSRYLLLRYAREMGMADATCSRAGMGRIAARWKMGTHLGGDISVCAFLAWALYEILRLWRTRATDERVIELILAPRYRLSTTALLVGLSGALLFLLHGPISYTATFDLIIQGALGTQDWPTPMRTVLLLAVMAGMLLSTLQRGTFRVDWRPQLSWLLNLSAGVLMGLGIALAPGGNDALVLDGIPIIALCDADLHRARGRSYVRTGLDAPVVRDRSSRDVPKRYVH
jgi:hypothetical protein